MLAAIMSDCREGGGRRAEGGEERWKCTMGDKSCAPFRRRDAGAGGGKGSRKSRARAQFIRHSKTARFDIITADLITHVSMMKYRYLYPNARDAFPVPSLAPLPSPLPLHPRSDVNPPPPPRAQATHARHQKLERQRHDFSIFLPPE